MNGEFASQNTPLFVLFPATEKPRAKLLHLDECVCVCGGPHLSLLGPSSNREHQCMCAKSVVFHIPCWADGAKYAYRRVRYRCRFSSSSNRTNTKHNKKIKQKKKTQIFYYTRSVVFVVVVGVSFLEKWFLEENNKKKKFSKTKEKRKKEKRLCVINEKFNSLRPHKKKWKKTKFQQTNEWW